MTPPAGLVRALHILGDFADVRGDSEEAAALRRAAAEIEQMPPAAVAELERRARRNRLEPEGLSRASADTGESRGPFTATAHARLRELILRGSATAIRTAQAGLPALFRQLLELRTIGSDEAAMLARQGILTAADLQSGLDDNRIGTAGDAFEGRLRSAPDALEPEGRSIPLGRAWDTAAACVNDIVSSSPTVDLLTPAGEVRRYEPLVSSIVIVGRSSDPPAAIEALARSSTVLHRSSRRAILMSREGEIDVRIAAPDEYGTVLFTATGSRAHLNAMRPRRGRPKLAAREEDIYGQAGLPFIPPELRHGSGEVDAAASGSLPDLISREHIRGDLHMHTTYSDGADTLEAVVAACCAVGYEYIAITDHSERAAAGRTLTRRDLARQRDEIAAMRERYPQIAILHGVEADIMPDGRLDFPDALLEPLDIVLASLHDSANHDGGTLTRRAVQAIRHPLVTILTHPANRIVGRREGYPLDFDALYAAAAETGTALEVDGAPSHIDLDGEHARAAIAAGVTLTIDSDCHRAAWLDRQMRFGIGTARRGWVEPRHVLNTRPLAEVRAFIAAKRALR